MQVMSHIPWELRDSSLLKKSHSLFLVSEILLHPNTCITSLWKVHEVRGYSKLSESKSQERVDPSLTLFPHSVSCPSLGVSAQLQPSSPTFLCKAIQGLPLSFAAIFLAGLLVLSMEDVSYICSLEAAHKKAWKRKKKKKSNLYICVVAQAGVVIGARVSLFINTDLRLNPRFPSILARSFQSAWHIHLTHIHLSNLSGPASADDN